MARKDYPDIGDGVKYLKMLRAGLEKDKRIERSDHDASDPIEELPVRLQRIYDIFNKHKNKKSTDMLHFVMYDIESNKVRRQVAKYLLAMGCSRVQKSIFLADLSPEKATKIKSDLAEVQACYDNEDSILILPVPTDYLQSMKIIGKNIDIDLITKSVNTLFF